MSALQTLKSYWRAEATGWNENSMLPYSFLYSSWLEMVSDLFVSFRVRGRFSRIC